MDITVEELKKRRDAGENILVIDVREPYEYEAANIGGKLIPLGSLMARLDELMPYKDQEIVLQCRSGWRSASACALLRQHGFTNPRNLVGGILAWKAAFDPSLNVT